MLLGNLFDEYLADVKRRCSFGSVSFVSSHLNCIMNVFFDLGIKNLDDLNSRSFNLVFDAWKKDHLSLSTIDKRFSLIKRALLYHGLSVPGFTDFRHVRYRQKSFRVVAIDSLKALMRYFSRLKDDFHGLTRKCIFFVLLYTGLRATELSLLKVKNVDLIDRSIFVEHTKIGDPRVVYFNKTLSELLKKYILLKDRDVLFWNIRYKKSYNGKMVLDVFRYTCLKLGIDHVTPHRLRHTFASMLYMNGASLKTIQALLGHKSMKTTDLYLHLSDGFIKRDYDLHFHIK